MQNATASHTNIHAPHTPSSRELFFNMVLHFFPHIHNVPSVCANSCHMYSSGECQLARYCNVMFDSDWSGGGD